MAVIIRKGGCFWKYAANAECFKRVERAKAPLGNYPFGKQMRDGQLSILKY